MPDHAWIRVRGVITIGIAELVKVPENLTQWDPERRTRRRCRPRKERQSVVDLELVRTNRRERNLRPEKPRDEAAEVEMCTSGAIKFTCTRMRLARKPTKAPADQPTAIGTGSRNKENGIHLKNRATSADQDLLGGGEKRVKLLLAILAQPDLQTRV